jgi:hypothetical protein
MLDEGAKLKVDEASVADRPDVLGSSDRHFAQVVAFGVRVRARRLDATPLMAVPPLD